MFFNSIFKITLHVSLGGLILAMVAPVQTPPPPVEPQTLPLHQYLPSIQAIPFLTPLGPDGGSITALVINPQNSLEIYAGTFGGGVYKSVNGGESWQGASLGLVDGYIQSLAIDPQTPTTLYAGMYAYGVYKTTDGGQSWFPTGPGLNHNAVVYDLQVDPVHPNILYAGTRSKNPVFEPPWGGGVYKSVNGGATWSAQNNGLAEDWVYSIAIDPTNPAVIYAALHTQGISKSIDGAGTWTSINYGLDDLGGRSVVVDPLHPQTVYLGTWHYGEVFKTTDGGASWQPARSGLPSIKVYKLAIDPVDPGIVYAASPTNGLFKSSNGGASWGGAGFGTDFVTSLGVNPQNHSQVFAGTSGAGLFRSPDGAGTWAASQNGLQASLVAKLAQNSSYLFAGLMGEGLARSPDGGKSWQSVGDFGHYSVNSVAVNPTNTNVVFAVTDRIGVLKSKDYGNTWAPMNTGLAAAAKSLVSAAGQNPAFPMDFYTVVMNEDPAPLDNDTKGIVPEAINYSVISLAFDPHDPMTDYIGTSANGIFKSANSGASWAASGLSGLAIYALAVDPNRSAYVYAATDGSSGSLWKSTDGGLHWSAANIGLQGGTVYDLLVEQLNSDSIYAATTAGIFHSSNGGGSWQGIGLADKIAYSLGLTPAGLYAGTRQGLFVTANQGASWQPISSRDPFQEVHAVLLDAASSGALFVGTNGHGVEFYP